MADRRGDGSNAPNDIDVIASFARRYPKHRAALPSRCDPSLRTSGWPQPPTAQRCSHSSPHMLLLTVMAGQCASPHSPDHRCRSAQAAQPKRGTRELRIHSTHRCAACSRTAVAALLFRCAIGAHCGFTECILPQRRAHPSNASCVFACGKARACVRAPVGSVWACARASAPNRSRRETAGRCGRRRRSPERTLR